MLGPKLIASLLIVLSVFTIVSYSSYQVSATDHIVSLTVRDDSPFAATIQNVTLQAWDFSSGQLLFYAHATDLPLTIQPGKSANVTLDVYMSPSAWSLPDSEVVHVVGYVSYSVGLIFHPSISVDSDYTVGQVRTVMQAAGAYA